MKSNDCITLLALLAVFAFFHPGHLHAEDERGAKAEQEEEFEEEEVPEPSKEDTLKFMKDKLPVAIEILGMIQEAEGEEEYGEVLEDFRGQYHEYLEIEQYDGPEAAALVLEGADLELQMDKTLHEFHEGDEDADRGEQEKKIHELVRKQWQHAIKVAGKELALIEEHRAEVQTELKELEAMDEAALKEWASELIAGDEGEDEDEDEGGDEEEDDEDGEDDEDREEDDEEQEDD